MFDVHSVPLDEITMHLPKWASAGELKSTTINLNFLPGEQGPRGGNSVAIRVDEWPKSLICRVT